MERYDSGITRVLNICKNYGIVAPEFREEEDGFVVVTIFNKKLIKKLSNNQIEIIELIQNQPKIRAEKMSLKIGINKRNIESNISTLKKKGILKRIGERKNK